MDRKTLEQYPDVVADIADTEAEIKLLTGRSIEIDTVRGSMPDFPYVSHPITIAGVTDSAELRQKQQELAELKRLKREMDDFISHLPNRRIRRIVTLKAVKRERWQYIADKLETSEYSVKHAYARVFKVKK